MNRILFYSCYTLCKISIKKSKIRSLIAALSHIFLMSDEVSSPADELAVDKIPLENVHIEDVKVKGIGFDTIEFAITADLWLPLIEVALRARLTVELLNIVRACVEQVAVIRFLIRCREATKDQDVLVRDLVKATALQADPVSVLFDPQVQCLPMLSPLNVILLDQVGALPTIEASNDEERLIFEGNRGVEIAPRI